MITGQRLRLSLWVFYTVASQTLVESSSAKRPFSTGALLNCVDGLFHICQSDQVLVFSFLCMCLCVCTHMCRYMWMWRPEVSFKGLPQLHSILFLQQGFSQNLDLTNSARLLESEPGESSCLCLPGAGITGTYHHSWLLRGPGY